MTVEFICVGTEILLGNIVNTNAAYLAEKCAGLGLSCYYQTVVGDNEERLLQTISASAQRSDIVLLCGGLGPTEDDLTKETVAKFCGLELKKDAHTEQRLSDFFEKRGHKPTANNWKQALVPEGAIIFDNHNGTAPGLAIELENTRFILLPGPPNELIPMFEEQIVPYLTNTSPGIIFSQTVKICGMGESTVETMVRDLIDTQTNPTIATYAKTGEVHIRVTAMAETKKEAKKLTKPMVKELKNRFGENVYTTDEDVTLEQAVVEYLSLNGLTVTCAESCTGGLLSARLINVPGASECYKAGFVTYSNKAKRKLLGVKKSTLQKYGAVSRQTAEEMARSVMLTAKADVGVSITGIAGPGGGTEEKPVGLVYIACCVKGQVTVREFHFDGNRAKVREASATAALVLMRSCMLECFRKKLFGEK